MGENPIPGLLYVRLSQNSLSDAVLNNWYNNQHTPGRMCYPFFVNGRRYRRVQEVEGVPSGNLAVAQSQDWLALYDISDMRQLRRKPYDMLLNDDVQGSIDRGYAAKITASRRYLDHVATYAAPGYSEDDHAGACAATAVMIVVRVKLVSSYPTAAAAEAEWNRWYEQDHLPPLKRVPGWRRTRRYRTSVLEDDDDETGVGTTEYLTINEFADVAYVGGPEHQAAIRTESRTGVVAAKSREVWQLEYVLGRGPKDLISLGQLVAEDVEAGEFVSTDGLTRTTTGCGKKWPTIEGHVVDHDGRMLGYRIEGWGGEKSPVVVVGTVAGLGWDVADSLVSALVQRWANLRVLSVAMRPTLGVINHPIVSGEHYQVLALSILALCSNIALPEPLFSLGIGVGGATVDRNFGDCAIQKWPETKGKNSSDTRGRIVGVTVSTKNTSVAKSVIGQLKVELGKFNSVTSYCSHVSQASTAEYLVRKSNI